jgi:hypothetical protein
MSRARDESGENRSRFIDFESVAETAYTVYIRDSYSCQEFSEKLNIFGEMPRFMGNYGDG